MYVSSRNLQATSLAVVPQAVALVNHVVGLINDKLGAQLGAGTQVGGDPTTIGVLGRYESLADYERIGLEMALDPEIMGAVQMGSHLFAPNTVDGLWNLRMAPNEQNTYSTVTSTQIELARISDAMAFAAEVATTVASITGQAVGLATAVTGDRSRIVWVGYNASLAELEAQTDQLESNDTYMDLFKRAEGLVVPNALENVIWRSTTA